MATSAGDEFVSGKPIALALGVILVGAAVFKWWPSEERAVRRQIDAVADTLTVPATDTDPSRHARLAELRAYLAPDIVVHAPGFDAASRDALLALLEGWRPPPGGQFVEIADEHVTLAGSGTASVRLTAKRTARDTQTGEPAVETKDADIRLAKRSGDWLITSVELRQAPPRP